MGSAALDLELFRTPNKVDPEFARVLFPFLEGLYQHYFRCDVSGFENLPPDPVLLVGNHNGLITFEVLMLFHAWWKHFGSSRPAFGLTHKLALRHPLSSWLMPRIGAIPADPDLAYDALSRGYSLLAYPGGLKESFRPYRERKKVDFFQRKGFIRLALKAKVPIVPVASIGAHETYIILHRGEELAERLGLKEKLKLHGIPVTFRSLFFLWCVASGLFTFFPLLLAPAAFASIFVPLPAKMSFRFLPAIDTAEVWNSHLNEDENIQAIYDRVVGSLQTALTNEYRNRLLPIVG